MTIKGELREYYSFKLNGYEKVYVSVDPYDREAPAVITDLDKNFIDLAEPVPHSIPGRESPEVEAFFKARKEYMKEIRNKVKQIRDGLGLVDKKEVVAIGKVSKTAKRAEKEQEIREEIKKEQQKQARVIRMEAKKERQRLRHSIQEVRSGYQIPAHPRERYRLWKELDAKRDSLSPEELAFWKHFQDSADFRAYRALEEDFGDVFMTRREKA